MALPAQEEPNAFLDSNHFLDPWATPETSRHCVLHNCLGLSPRLSNLPAYAATSQRMSGGSRSWKRQERSLPLRLWREHGLDNTLVLDLWPPVL